MANNWLVTSLHNPMHCSQSPSIVLNPGTGLNPLNDNMPPSIAANGFSLLTGTALHQSVVVEGLLQARSHVWIATADLKDMHIKQGRRFVPVLSVFDTLAERGVSFRIVHAALPSRPFRASLEALPRLTSGALELQICPRSHWKLLVVDHQFAYCGSANFTGAGLGARSARKRNMEMGFVTRTAAEVEQIAQAFDTFWVGEHCDDCGLRERCPDPVR